MQSLLERERKRNGLYFSDYLVGDFHLQSRPKSWKYIYFQYSMKTREQHGAGNHVRLKGGSISSGVQQCSGEANFRRLENLSWKIGQKNVAWCQEICSLNLNWWFGDGSSSQVHDQHSQIIISNEILCNLTNRQTGIIQSRCQEVKVAFHRQRRLLLIPINIHLPMNSRRFTHQRVSSVLPMRINEIWRRDRLLVNIKCSKRKRTMCYLIQWNVSSIFLLAAKRISVHWSHQISNSVIKHRIKFNKDLRVSDLNRGILHSNFQIIWNRAGSCCPSQVGEEIHRWSLSLSVQREDRGILCKKSRQEESQSNRNCNCAHDYFQFE